MFKSSFYSLWKSRHIFNVGNKWYQKKRHVLTADELRFFESHLKSLDEAIANGQREEANRLAHEVESFYQARFKKSIFDYLKELGLAIGVALLIAIVVRQMWFELYEIPTGSMRPTFEEQDRLTVTKTAFGLNVPLATKHFYFDPSLVQRTSVVIWSGDGIPNLDSESTFMNIFPYTKRYIKRCMGKPGDTIYFYGGKIYGFDREGHDLAELRNSSWLKGLDHVPFTYFEGRTSTSTSQASGNKQVTFHLFDQPVGRLRFGFGSLKGEVFNGHEWIADRPDSLLEPHQTIQTYSDFAGMRNFGKSRLLTKAQLEEYTVFSANEMEEGVLYLEIQHTPNLVYPHPILLNHAKGALLRGYTTVIPLQEKHIQALRQHLYTARFVVRDGRAAPYYAENQKFNASNPIFDRIPNGTYEFYYGKGYQIGWGGVPYALAADHPLYQSSMLQKLFNNGIEVQRELEPHQRDYPIFPSRYAYFRDGALYVMGGVLMDKEDPILVNFNQREQQREKRATKQAPYIAFKDYGPPLTEDGKLDQAFIKSFGFTIPDTHYLMLGDNHAMSQDSRYFGPIPQANLQGAPSLIIWPPGERWGIPMQKPYPLITIPRLIVWSIVGLCTLLWWLRRHQQLNHLQFKQSTSN